MPHPLVYNCAERELLAHGGTLELRKMSQVFCLDLSRIFWSIQNNHTQSEEWCSAALIYQSCISRGHQMRKT